MLFSVYVLVCLEVDGVKRSYRVYMPKGLAKGAPLVMVLHGSGQHGAQIRLETGYGFDRLADQHRFAIVYPSGKSFDWNDCSKTGDFSVDGRELDDVKYLNSLVDKLLAEHGFDARRVFATGVSSGGFMSLRLALESPTRFRAVAAVSANLPVADNFKCNPAKQGTSVMIMNGTKDPLVPYAGGESALFGLFYKNGKLRSSLDSADFFANHNQISQAFATDSSLNSSQNSERFNDKGEPIFERKLWRNESKVEVELVSIRDAGHGMPQPYWKRPRLLGPSPMAPNGPEMIWDFFARQRP
jgi:polyhydroxybutyrate depolymerase